jgi:hypothetical protein
MQHHHANVSWRSRRHPVFALLREDGRQKRWLAGKIGYSAGHVRNVAAGFWPASARFRAACADLFGRDETDLFDEHGGSTPAPTEGDIRAGAAVRASYPRRAGVSTLLNVRAAPAPQEEAPQTRSA